MLKTLRRLSLVGQTTQKFRPSEAQAARRRKPQRNLLAIQVTLRSMDFLLLLLITDTAVAPMQEENSLSFQLHSRPLHSTPSFQILGQKRRDGMLRKVTTAFRHLTYGSTISGMIHKNASQSLRRQAKSNCGGSRSLVLCRCNKKLYWRRANSFPIHGAFRSSWVIPYTLEEPTGPCRRRAKRVITLRMSV